MEHLQKQLVVRLRDVLVLDIRQTIEQYPNMEIDRNVERLIAVESCTDLDSLAQYFSDWYGEETTWHGVFNAMWQILKIAGHEYNNLKEVLDNVRSQNVDSAN